MEIVYGPVSLGGLNFWKLSTKQTILQIQQFLRHTQNRTCNEKLVLISCQWAQYSCGTEEAILRDVTTNIEYAKNP